MGPGPNINNNIYYYYYCFTVFCIYFPLPLHSTIILFMNHMSKLDYKWLWTMTWDFFGFRAWLPLYRGWEHFTIVLGKLFNLIFHQLLFKNISLLFSAKTVLRFYFLLIQFFLPFILDFLNKKATWESVNLFCILKGKINPPHKNSLTTIIFI